MKSDPQSTTRQARRAAPRPGFASFKSVALNIPKGERCTMASSLLNDWAARFSQGRAWVGLPVPIELRSSGKAPNSAKLTIV
jgi:hypothetical protein